MKAELREKIDISDPKAANSRREALSAILSIEPLSSVNWLSLSGMQLVTDQPMEQVLESLELSMVTGPNEGYVMADRGIFGVSLWERLSPELKRRVAADLAAGEITGERKVSGCSFRKIRAGAERAPGRLARNRTFAERGRTTTGILGFAAETEFRTVGPLLWAALGLGRPGRNQSDKGGATQHDMLTIGQVRPVG